jgi:hypothetical protein
LFGTLQLALSSKINDRDDFKRLILKSEDGTAEAYIFREDEDIFTLQLDGIMTRLQADEVINNVEKLIQQGFRKLTCKCYSGDMNIEVPSGKGKLKISYTRSEIDDNTFSINPEEANKLLEAIEMVTSDGSVKADMRRKFVQIDNFIKLIQPLLNKSSQNKKVFILDCGSGKSYLSYVMNYYLREKMRRNCHFFCIDTNADLIEKCIRVKKELEYDNMEFHVSRIKDFQPSEKVDIVCSLHACDTATDEAIAKGIQLEAPFMLIVPCCQHEIINQLTEHPLKAITRHGLYKAKLADLLTDAMRTLILEAVGYKVTVTEYVSPIYTPKNILIQAEKIQSRNKMAMDQYLELKSNFGGISVELESLVSDRLWSV